MRRCPWCGKRLSSDWERQGARCSHCREALYEGPQPPRAVGSEDSPCATHPDNAAVATCQRCGNFVCAVCRTRWRDTALCPGCVERALEAGEGLPQQQRLQWTHAGAALVLGIGSWVLAIVGFTLLIVGFTSENLGLVGVGVILFMFSGLPAILSVGLGASAIRARGAHMIVATIGLLLGGLLMGVLIGMVFSLMNQ